MKVLRNYTHFNVCDARPTNCATCKFEELVVCVNNPKGVVGRNQRVRTDRTVHVEETVKRNKKKSKCHVLCS